MTETAVTAKNCCGILAVTQVHTTSSILYLLTLLMQKITQANKPSRKKDEPSVKIRDVSHRLVKVLYMQEEDILEGNINNFRVNV